MLVLLFRSAELVDALAPDSWRRILVTAAGLTVVLVAGARFSGGNPGPATGLVLTLAVTALLRAGQHGLFSNLSLVPAVLIAATTLHFKPWSPVLAAYAVCSTAACLLFYGYVHTGYPSRQLEPVPAGVSLHFLSVGEPGRAPGAHIFNQGSCPDTLDSRYLGESAGTFRIDREGRRTDFVTREAHNESVYNVIERCAAHELISGSEEGRYLRISALDDGRTLANLPLRGMPTTLILSPDGRYVFASTMKPATLVRVDLDRRAVDKEFTQWAAVDPSFSGSENMVLVGDRLVSAYSSYNTLDGAPGTVFSVNLDLDDRRDHFSFGGSFAALARGPDAASVYLKVYSRPGLWKVPLDGREAAKVADVPAGFYFMARMDDPAMVVLDHWSTGQLWGLCINDPARTVAVDLGGMGRTIAVVGNRLMTPAAAGYATVTLSRQLCP
jgi:hypothetical protein